MISEQPVFSPKTNLAADLDAVPLEDLDVYERGQRKRTLAVIIWIVFIVAAVLGTFDVQFNTWESVIALYSLALLAEAGREKAARGDMSRVQEHLGEIGATAQQALREMRLLVHELRPLLLEREGLVTALNQRLDAVERRAGIDARLLTENWSDVPAPIEEELYHIARETLNNALKHAAETSVTVQLRRLDGRVQMEISNNGRSFDPILAREGGGLGLTSMLERTEKLGGQLTISSAPDEGTKVTVEVPVS